MYQWRVVGFFFFLIINRFTQQSGAKTVSMLFLTKSAFTYMHTISTIYLCPVPKKFPVGLVHFHHGQEEPVLSEAHPHTNWPSPLQPLFLAVWGGSELLDSDPPWWVIQRSMLRCGLVTSHVHTSFWYCDGWSFFPIHFEDLPFLPLHIEKHFPCLLPSSSNTGPNL